MGTTGQRAIDFRRIAEDADLSRLIEDDRGPADRSRRYLCPFHDDHTPDLSIDQQSNRYRCWACGANGDAIDWLTEHRGMTTIEAAKYLGADVGVSAGDKSTTSSRPPAARQRAVTPPQQPAAWSNVAWQATVDRIVCEAEVELWSPSGQSALDWLRWRGLLDHAIRRFRLGFVARPFESQPLDCLPRNDDGNRKGIFVARGIVFPYALPGSWYSRNESPPAPRWAGANVRQLMPDVFEPLPRTGPSRKSKCLEFRGTERGHLYPHPDIEETQGELAALVVEGEVDALVGWQEAGHAMHVGTVGGANTSPKPSAMEALGHCPHWLISTDHDEAGSTAAREWQGRSPDRARRALLPHGKDLGEFHQDGGDVLGWLKAEHQRLGWSWSP